MDLPAAVVVIIVAYSWVQWMKMILPELALLKERRRLKRNQRELEYTKRVLDREDARRTIYVSSYIPDDSPDSD